MRRRVSLVIALYMLLLCLPGGAAAEEAYERFSMSFFNTFDTIITIIGYAREKAVFEGVTQEARRRFESLHEVFDGYNAYEGVKNLYYMNQQAPKGPVEVDPELMSLLLFCKEAQPHTNGTVNVALGAVLEIWHAFREDAEYDPEGVSPPSMEALREAAKHVDFDQVLLEPETNTVTYLDPYTRIDLGSVAKGYAAQLVGEWMMESGMPSFILSAGGNVVVGDPPLDGRLRWGVGVQDPDGVIFGDPDANMDVLFVSGTSVVTSGDYQRYVVVDGMRYHHIISPDTLMPADTMRAVTIVTKDSGWSDILSTAVFVMPYEAGRVFVDSLEGVEALWVLNDHTVEMTEGLRAMAKSEGATNR
ncbi:MAG: FAD:protein FMN transferase [Firmicutes bacterium]|nr:FAD:protein FMN transferase [Bacillota bacterium]